MRIEARQGNRQEGPPAIQTAPPLPHDPEYTGPE